MRTSVWKLASLALIAASTVPLLAQASQAPPPAPAMALTGCVAAAAMPAGSAAAEPPSTSNADRYILTKAAVAPPAEGQPAANQPKPPTATQYRLNGPLSMLAPYVAHQVKVTGKIEEPATKPASGANMPTFKVDAVRMLEATCS